MSLHQFITPTCENNTLVRTTVLFPQFLEPCPILPFVSVSIKFWDFSDKLTNLALVFQAMQPEIQPNLGLGLLHRFWPFFGHCQGIAQTYCGVRR